MKIIYSLDLNPNVLYEKSIVKNLQHHGYTIKIVDWLKELGINYYPSREQIRELYHAKDPKLINLYKKIRNLSKTHEVLIVAQSHVYLPEFIESLDNIYTVFCSGDDPDSSEVCSKPYVKHYDHAFAVGVNFDKNTKIIDKFLEWDAKRANWWPLGFREDTYNQNLTVNDIYQKERCIDLAFVGEVLLKKRRDYLTKLKRAFPQMKIFSRSFKTKKNKLLINLYFTAKTRTWCWERYIPHNQLSSLYQNVKIGINMHWSYGPSNIRTYQLPANGVMQICDCSEGLNQIYKVGKEVILYNSIEEAIELIQYYLENDEERKKIATMGFKRAIRDYKREKTFLKALKDIKIGISEKAQ